MNLKNIASVGLTILSVSLTACASSTVGFAALGSHTLRVAPEQEVDVVWLLKDEGVSGSTQHKQTVLRCHNSDQGPSCDPAKIPQ